MESVPDGSENFFGKGFRGLSFRPANGFISEKTLVAFSGLLPGPGAGDLPARAACGKFAFIMDALIGLFRANFYLIDFSVGIIAPVLVYGLVRLGRLDRYFWRLFWVGFAIGLCWEVPMQVLNQLGPGLAVHAYVREPPVPFIVIIILHSSWDGGLFLLGVGLARLILRRPALARFNPAELVIYILWGQASELWVELTATYGGAWHYVPRSWNPALFTFNSQPITLLPQLIWLAAPIVFYLIALKRSGVAQDG